MWFILDMGSWFKLFYSRFTDTPSTRVFAVGLLGCDTTEQISTQQPLSFAEAAVDQRGFCLTYRSSWTSAQSFPNERPRRWRVDVGSLQPLVDIDQSGSHGHDSGCPDGLISVVPQSNQPTSQEKIATFEALITRQHSIN